MTAIRLPLRPWREVRTSRLHRIRLGWTRPVDRREATPHIVRAPWFGF